MSTTNQFGVAELNLYLVTDTCGETHKLGTHANTHSGVYRFAPQLQIQGKND